MILALLAERQIEGHEDKTKNHTYSEGVLVVREFSQCWTVFGLPVSQSLVWQQQTPVSLLCDPHTLRRDVLFITLDPEKDTVRFQTPQNEER